MRSVMANVLLLQVVLLGLSLSALGQEQKEQKNEREVLRRSDQFGWQQEDGHYQSEQKKALNKATTKKVHKPSPKYPLEDEKKIPYEVRVPVERPYPVYIPQPYPVYIEKKVPFEVKVPVPQPFTIEKKVPYHVNVPEDKAYQETIEKPYTVFVQEKLPYSFEKRYPYALKVNLDRPYPVTEADKEIPYSIDKAIPYPVKVPFERPVAYFDENAYTYHVDKKVAEGAKKQAQKQAYRQLTMVERVAVPVTEEPEEAEYPRPAPYRQEGPNVFADGEEFVSTTVQVKDPKENEEASPVPTSYSQHTMSNNGKETSYSTSIQHY